MSPADLPIIDLAVFSPAALLEACEGLGCFRVVNHGIPTALQAEMKATVRSFLDLPEDAKRSNMDVIAGSGYVGPTRENPLYEALGLYDAANPADVDAFTARLSASPHQRGIVKSYSSKIHELAVDLSSKIAGSMGLSNYSFEDWPCQFRLNKYNFTEETVGSSGVQIHTDSGFLTVLQEDESVGGLEVMDRTGTFLPVNPVPGSLLVNLGDTAQVPVKNLCRTTVFPSYLCLHLLMHRMIKAWSNGRLHNVKHRVQCKVAAVRVSVALFLLAPKDDIVEAPAAFVDQGHPRLYQTFAYEEYRKLLFSSGMSAGGVLSLLAYDQASTKYGHMFNK